jgi:hypothetical protein
VCERRANPAKGLDFRLFGDIEVHAPGGSRRALPRPPRPFRRHPGVGSLAEFALPSRVGGCYLGFEGLPLRQIHRSVRPVQSNDAR